MVYMFVFINTYGYGNTLIMTSPKNKKYISSSNLFPKSQRGFLCNLRTFLGRAISSVRNSRVYIDKISKKNVYTI